MVTSSSILRVRACPEVVVVVVGVGGGGGVGVGVGVGVVVVVVVEIYSWSPYFTPTVAVACTGVRTIRCQSTKEEKR